MHLVTESSPSTLFERTGLLVKLMSNLNQAPQEWYFLLRNSSVHLGARKIEADQSVFVSLPQMDWFACLPMLTILFYPGQMLDQLRNTRPMLRRTLILPTRKKLSASGHRNDMTHGRHSSLPARQFHHEVAQVWAARPQFSPSTKPHEGNLAIAIILGGKGAVEFLSVH